MCVKEIPNDIYIKQIIPTFTTIVVTADTYTKNIVSKGGILTDLSKKEGMLKEYQYVVSVGPSVRTCKVGDLVKLNPMNYAVVKKKKQNSIASDMEEHYKNEIVGFDFKTIELDGIKHMLFQDNEIEYVISEFTSLDTIKEA